MVKKQDNTTVNEQPKTDAKFENLETTQAKTEEKTHNAKEEKTHNASTLGSTNEDTPVRVKDDEVFIHSKGVIKLKPTKLKYFKDNSYNNFMIIKNMGINEVLKYQDGEDIIRKYLGAVFDVDEKEIDFIDEMDTKTLFDIMDKINKINDIKDSDFLTQLKGLGVEEESV